MISYKAINFTRCSYYGFMSLNDSLQSEIINYLQQFNPQIFSFQECNLSLESEYIEGRVFKEDNGYKVYIESILIHFVFNKKLQITSLIPLAYLRAYISQLQAAQEKKREIRGERVRPIPAEAVGSRIKANNKFINILRKNLGL